MSTRKLAMGLAVNRILFGVGFIVSPVSSGRSWIGTRAARRPGTQLFARAIGARDVGLGLGALRSLRQEDDGNARAWMLAQAISDGTDLAATLAARDKLPRTGFAFGVAVAGLSTAVGAWSAASLGRQRAARP